MNSLFSRFYDTLMNPLEQRMFRAIRKELVGKAIGNVIEIGSGTGVNFRFYKNINHLTAIEPNAAMREKSMLKMKDVSFPIEIVDVNAESLPYADKVFVSAVATLVFCSISGPSKALYELRRICGQ